MIFDRSLKGIAAALWLLCVALPAAAQVAGPGEAASAPTIDRERPDRVAPNIAPVPAAPVAPSPVVGPVGEPAAGVKLARVHYMGSSLSVALLNRAVAPLLGRPLTRETLQAVAKAVGDAYARSDIAFYAVSIPAQIPAGGQLILRIVEGRVTAYQLAGLSPTMPVKLIEAQMRRVKRDTPLRKSVLQRALGLLRDIPGQSVEARVRQGGGEGELILDLIVKRKQVQIGLLIDNSGVSNVIDGVQAQLSVTANGLLREGDSTRVAGYLPFYPDRYQFYSLNHSTPIGSNGTTVTANIAHMQSRVRDRPIEGEATLAGVTVSHALIRSNHSNLTVNATLDGIDSSNYFLDVRFGDYRSRAMRLGASWSRSDAQRGYAASAVLSQGVGILGARAFTGFSDKAFTKVNAQAVAVRTLSTRLSLKLTAKAQYSADKLPVTERFALGGRGAGMAFRVGTRTAESALTGSAQLDWTPSRSPPLHNAALFAYVDGAVAHEVARPFYHLPAQDFSLASAGGGMRIGIGGKWRASVELAVPIKRIESGDPRKARFFFGIGRTF
jgi:hemolysin activation/secretion protein